MDPAIYVSESERETSSDAGAREMKMVDDHNGCGVTFALLRW